MLVFYELVVMWQRRTRYFKGFYNFTDIVLYLLFIPTFVLLLLEPDDDSSHEDENILIFAKTLYISLLGIRSLMHLRVIDGIRYLIAMILRVFVDIQNFIVVLLVSIFTLALIKYEIFKHLPANNGDYDIGHFVDELKKTYEYGYGNFE